MDQQRKFLLMAGGLVAILLGIVGFILGRRRAHKPA
jgi:LPXTG-motif cell wall-anchored protein